MGCSDGVGGDATIRTVFVVTGNCVDSGGEASGDDSVTEGGSFGVSVLFFTIQMAPSPAAMKPAPTAAANTTSGEMPGRTAESCMVGAAGEEWTSKVRGMGLGDAQSVALG